MFSIRLPLALILLVIAGCGGETAGPERAAEVTQVAAAESGGARVATSPTSAKTSTTVPGQPDPADQKAADSKKKAAEFTPPYPKRLDPFQRPDFNKLASSKRQQEQTGTQDVQLKGFVNLKGLRALLCIDGRVTAVGEGEERAGLQIISVAPPEVIMQRGRLRWTETLYRLQ